MAKAQTRSKGPKLLVFHLAGRAGGPPATIPYPVLKPLRAFLLLPLAHTPSRREIRPNPLGSGSGNSGRHSRAEPGPDPSTAAGGMTGGGAAAASQAYGEAWYWDERYRKEAGPFDWYQKYPALAPLLRLYVSPHHRLLLVGCGNSGESRFLSVASVRGPAGLECLSSSRGEGGRPWPEWSAALVHTLFLPSSPGSLLSRVSPSACDCGDGCAIRRWWLCRLDQRGAQCRRPVRTRNPFRSRITLH
jgi:hypothetical protein